MDFDFSHKINENLYGRESQTPQIDEEQVISLIDLDKQRRHLHNQQIILSFIPDIWVHDRY